MLSLLTSYVRASSYLGQHFHSTPGPFRSPYEQQSPKMPRVCRMLMVHRPARRNFHDDEIFVAVL
jgi:hypothetical protein